MHANHVEEGLAVDVPTRASGARHHVRSQVRLGEILLSGLGRRNQRFAELGNARRLQVGFAAHDRGHASGIIASGIGVIGKPGSHQQGAQIGIAQAKWTVVMRVLADHFGRIARVVDQNLLRRNQNVDGMTIGRNIKRAVGRKLQQVQAGQVAGGIIEEHVLATRIAGVDASRVFRSVPAVDGGIELHAGITAMPGSLADLFQEIFGFVGSDHGTIADRLGGEVRVAHHRIHEVVGHAHAVVRVLEEDGTIGFGIRRGSVVSGLDQ